MAASIREQEHSQRWDYGKVADRTAFIGVTGCAIWGVYTACSGDVASGLFQMAFGAAVFSGAAALTHQALGNFQRAIKWIKISINCVIGATVITYANILNQPEKERDVPRFSTTLQSASVIGKLHFPKKEVLNQCLANHSMINISPYFQKKGIIPAVVEKFAETAKHETELIEELAWSLYNRGVPKLGMNSLSMILLAALKDCALS